MRPGYYMQRTGTFSLLHGTMRLEIPERIQVA
jgi:hypothetical protein